MSRRLGVLAVRVGLRRCAAAAALLEGGAGEPSAASSLDLKRATVKGNSLRLYPHTLRWCPAPLLWVWLGIDVPAARPRLEQQPRDISSSALRPTVRNNLHGAGPPGSSVDAVRSAIMGCNGKGGDQREQKKHDNSAGHNNNQKKTDGKGGGKGGDVPHFLYPPEMASSMIHHYGGGFYYGTSVEVPAGEDESIGYARFVDEAKPEEGVAFDQPLLRSSSEHGSTYVLVPPELAAKALKSNDLPGMMKEMHAKFPEVCNQHIFPKHLVGDDHKRALTLWARDEHTQLKIDRENLQREVAAHPQQLAKYQADYARYQEAKRAFDAASPDEGLAPPREPAGPPPVPEQLDAFLVRRGVKVIFVNEHEPFNMPPATWLKSAVGHLPRDAKIGAEGYEQDVYGIFLRHLEGWAYIDQEFEMKKVLMVQNGNKKMPKIVKGGPRQALLEVLSITRGLEPKETAKGDCDPLRRGGGDYRLQAPRAPGY